MAHDQNRTCINLAASLDLTHDRAALVDFDIAALFNAPRPLSFEHDGTATHSRAGDPIAAALVANLASAFRLRQVIDTQPGINLPSVARPLYLPQTFTPYQLIVSKTFPVPDLPRDNPLIEERVTADCFHCHGGALFTDHPFHNTGLPGTLEHFNQRCGRSVL